MQEIALVEIDEEQRRSRVGDQVAQRI